MYLSLMNIRRIWNWPTFRIHLCSLITPVTCPEIGQAALTTLYKWLYSIEVSMYWQQPFLLSSLCQKASYTKRCNGIPCTGAVACNNCVVKLVTAAKVGRGSSFTFFVCPHQVNSPPGQTPPRSDAPCHFPPWSNAHPSWNAISVKSLLCQMPPPG